MRKWLSIAALIVIIDQISKLWVEHSFTYDEKLAILPFLNITLHYNTGAAFSFLADAGGWQRYFFTGLAALVSAYIIYMLKTQPQQKWQAWGLTFVLGGAIGNLIDRLYLGHVIDFIQVYYDTHYYPTFNMADSAITIGVGLMIWDMINEHRKAKRHEGTRDGQN